MAKIEKPQSEEARQARVYKASGVHKRRVSGKPRAQTKTRTPESDAPADGGADKEALLKEPSPGVERESKIDADAAKTELLPATPDEEPADKRDAAESARAIWPQQPEANSDEDDPAPCEPAPKPARRRSRAKTVALVVALALALVVVGLGAAFAWDRWGRYDDFADMQGEWYVAGTTASVSIEGNRLQLTEDVSYDFDIDDHAKTISYAFGPLEGQGRYWFSDDRRFLAITDGEGYNGAVTALEDIARRLSALTGPASATGAPLPEGENVVVLCREPGKLASLAVQAQERGRKKTEKKKAAEEEAAARKAAQEEEQAEREEQGEAGETAEAASASEAAAAETQAQPDVAAEGAYEEDDGEAERVYDDEDAGPSDQESSDEQSEDGEVYDDYA